MNPQTPSTTVHIPTAISVNDFARKLGVPATSVITELMKNGVMATINELIDYETAAIIGAELGFEIEPETETEQERPNQTDDTDVAKQARPPVVAVMGHVDHGKTSLLDAIRATNVVSGEAGGITQHIGAYQATKNGRIITFLDTPGHEAFSAIRAHGAKMTDLAIIVVAADDGVMPQTREVVAHAKAANVPVIVAINKVDKPGADINRVKQQLADIGLTPDDWGGNVPCVPVSAKTGQDIDKLLDMVLLVADIASPAARFEGPARGLVIESHVESGRGPVVTLLVQEGTLKLSDYIVAGETYGKVRNLEDYRGAKIREATPSTPAIVLGLKSLPAFGDWFEVVESERIARDWVSKQAKSKTIKSLMSVKSASAADLAAAVEEGKIKELALLVKADVAGSLESLTTSLEHLGNDEVRVRIINSGIGPINETDVNQAAAAEAMIVGFNVSISAAINQLAKRARVEFKLYRVIYELLDDVRGWLTALLPPEVVETELGRLEVLAIFKTTRDTIVTGGKVTSGKITPNLAIHVERQGKLIGDSKLTSLQKNKQAAREVGEGEECGLVIENFGQLQPGDNLVFYQTEQRQRSL